MFNNSTFDPRQQQRLIDHKGDQVDWFPARKCSCTFDFDSNRANPNCRVCKGLGYTYLSSTRIVGIVHSVNNSKMLIDGGIIAPGDMVFSEPMMSAHPITDFDMIRLTTTAWPYEGDLVTRGTDPVDLLVYTAISVTDVLQMDALTGTTTSYARGADWTHATGTDAVVWTDGGSAPATGSTYSVKYDALYDWICFAPPAQRFERGTPLGNRVYLRKKHVILGKSND